MYSMKKITSVLALSTLLLGSTSFVPADAYYDKYNYTEAVWVQTNQTAFWVPDVGDTKSNQAAFGSIDFYNASKVAAKRFEIPHSKLVNSGTFTDYFVPVGRLIIVNRIPFHREWTDEVTTGTSTKAEGFHFESKDSLNIEANVAIAASILEEDAAKFLYWFGVKAADYRADHPEDQFQSVVYANSLEYIMDTIVRGAVQARLAREFGKYDLADAIGKKAEIMDTVVRDITSEFREKGIHIEYIGYDSALNFDKAVQEAINDRFAATQKAAELTTLSSTIPVQEAQTNMDVKRILAGKWNGVLTFPTFIPSGFLDRVLGWFTTSAQQVSTK
jgi:hypothetical protein